jgi:hypothetical protein
MIQKFDKRALGRFKIAIADQASYVKTYDSDWAKILIPFLMSMKRIILLTGSNF